MKGLFLSFITAAYACSASAQPSFEKYYLGSGTYRFNMIELPSHNLFVGMGGIWIMDQGGNPLQNNYFWGDSILSLQAVNKSVDNKFVFVTNYYGDTCFIQNGSAIRAFYPMLGRMDSMGHVFDLRRYILNAGCQNTARDLTLTSDNGVITWGTDAEFFALKADSTLNHVWSKHFEQRGGFQFIKELPSGDLLAGINMDTAGAVVARLAANGDFLWCKSYMRQGIVHDCLIESDSSFIIIGYTDSIGSTNGSVPLPLDYDPKLFMMKLDGAGQVLWCKGYTSEPKWYARRGLRIVHSIEGAYVLLANIGILDYNLPSRPFLMKTDQNGDSLWTRSAARPNYSYKTIELIASSDGGFLYNGTAYGDFGSWSGASYIFKTDALGHLPCLEVHQPVGVLDLFPIDSNMVLISVNGATTVSAFAQDTTNGSMPVIDYCSSTGVAEAQVKKFRVYPNPNAGRFTVAFKDPLIAESYYSVYDALGKLLYQRPLLKGKETEEVDMSNYGKGTYVIKFTDKEGVCLERVVVE